MHISYINFRETRKGNQAWTIQRHWQNWTHKAQNEDKQNKTTKICITEHKKTKKISNTDQLDSDIIKQKGKL